MQKYMAAVYALVVMIFVAGCGVKESSTPQSPLPLTVAVKAADISGKTFYVSPVGATPQGGYLKFHFDPTGTAVQWSSVPVTAGEPALDVTGTWNFGTIETDKALILTGGATTRKITIIQKEASYWLAYDDGTLKTSRLYFDAPSSPPGSALTSLQGYLADIATTVVPSATPNAAKLGGSIQGVLPLAAAFSNISTVAGTATAGSSDGTGLSASFAQPAGIATDGTNLYVADSANHTIRKINIASKAVTRLAGNPRVAGLKNSNDGTGDSAYFNTPTALTVVGTYLYVADTYNNQIRRVDTSSGAVTLMAGSTGGLADAVDSLNGTDARFNRPAGITSDGTNLYVADNGNHIIRKIVISSGAVVTLAGSAKSLGSSDSTDSTGATARFNLPARITTDGTHLYVADSANSTVRKIAIATGSVTTLAGAAGSRDSTDSTDGTGATARFYQPNGITTDGSDLYVTDAYSKVVGSNNSVGYSSIRRIRIANGAVTTIINGEDGSSNGSISPLLKALHNPIGITTDGVSLYVADSFNNLIRIIKP